MGHKSICCPLWLTLLDFYYSEVVHAFFYLILMITWFNLMQGDVYFRYLFYACEPAFMTIGWSNMRCDLSSTGWDLSATHDKCKE